jgi:hypothetical protein
MIDEARKSGNNEYIVIEGETETLKIKKKDLVWQRTGDHEHHYLPDFTDETDSYIALKCVQSNCIHGRLVRKNDKKFMKWLETHRKSRTTP